MQMPHRRKTALAALAFVLAPVLSSCGFNYATDRDYTPGVGANDRSASVDVLSAMIVSDKAGQGVLVATLSNGSRTDASSLTAVTSDEADVSSFGPVEIEPQGLVNLDSDDFGPIQVTQPGTAFETPAPTKGAKKADAEHADEHGEASETAAYDEDVLVQAGRFVTVKFQFSGAEKETVTLNVPVVGNCGYHANTAGLPAGAEHCPTGNKKAEGHH